MMPTWFPVSTSRHRRGVVAVQFAVMSTAVFGFAALVVDVGMLYNVRTDLQRAADAAALAGASAYLGDDNLMKDKAKLKARLIAEVTERAQRFSLQNTTLGKGTILDVADTALGTHDFDNPTGPLLSSGRVNAVQVTVRRAPDSANGAVPFLFAGIFGLREGAVTATARAAINDQMAGYDAGEDGGYGGLLPFAVHEALYDDRFNNGPDNFSYDDGVLPTGDGVPEVNLYPWKWKEVKEVVGGLPGETTEEWVADIDGGSGNFGTLNIGLGSQGTSFLEEQIRNGIAAADLEAEFGTSELMFHDEVDGPQTLSASGNPGLSASLQDTLNERLGQVVGYFTHRGIHGTGSGTTYDICGIRFGRIVKVELTGGSGVFTIQPVAYGDGNVIVSSSAPSTDGHVGRLALVQ